METDVGKLQPAEESHSAKQVRRVGGKQYQRPKGLKTFKSAFRNNMQNQCRIFRDWQIMVEVAGISCRWCWDSRFGR